MDRPAAGPVLVLRCLGEGSGMRSVQGKVGGRGKQGWERSRENKGDREREGDRKERKRGQSENLGVRGKERGEAGAERQT